MLRSIVFCLVVLFPSWASAAVHVAGVNTTSDAGYAADVSSTDLVNAGAASLASGPTYSSPVHFGPTANNNGTVGASGETSEITFWLNAAAGNQYTITYALDTSVNTLGYDINSLQTIHGWTSNSGHQKNQNYVVEVSAVGSANFITIATVAYLPFTSANTSSVSTKVTVTEDVTGILASGVDEIRFTYTVPTPAGTQGSPTIREIDVFGTPSGPDTTDPLVSTLSPANNEADVSTDSNLVITFNEVIAIGSGDITIKNLDAPSQTAIPVGNTQVTVSGSVLTINPGTDLDINTNYAMQIAATAIDDLAGNSFAGITNDITWNFTTIDPNAPDTTDPLVDTLSPEDNTEDVPLDSNLVITFDEDIAIGSGDITIKNLDAPSQTAIPVGDAQVTLSGAILTINPATDLDSNTNYAVQIASTAIDDLAGNSFAGITVDTIWNFTTESIPLVATSPATRQVVQRNGSNLGTIPVAGTVGSSIDRIEARAVAPGAYDKNLGAVWFIGDSITQSNADGDGNGSPRKSLYDLLVADGASFSFTGHSTSNVDGLPATGGTAATNLYHYHSGVSGSVIGAAGGRTNMTAGISTWWNSARLASTRPNIVLIMLGTNDIDINADVANAPARMKLLVDTILAQVGPGDPDPAIFVAQITPNTGSAAELQRVIDFNSALPAVIATLQGEGKDVTLVDQFTTINANTAGLMRDSLHTNAAGNDVMASQWFDAIKTRFATTINGTTTPWQTIATNPEGAFSGNLTNVDAGGWYSVEVRSIVSETPVETVTVNKVGVGDIYLTAGQSNSANYGSPALTPVDDRVVARSSASANTWVHAADPMPIATGSGGSVWSRLGDLLVAAEDVPIGFVAVGVGGTQVSQWVPGTSNYVNRLKPALQSFPGDGFRAVLWHQGESDSIAGVTTSTHANRLNSMVSQSRTDAGWSVPWYLAEASFHPNSSLVNEERITAGQRAAVHGDALIFLGPSTDEFHLEDAAGGKLADSVHFNGAGLLDHATQWSEILRGTSSISPRNGNFEDNRTVAITNLTGLSDGGVHIAATSDNDSPMVLDWRILAASGVDVADGNNGFHNPTTGTFAGAMDSINGGVLPNMDGPHVALLDGGSADNYFLQSTRVAAEADHVYTLTVALGVRDNPATFGGARLEITSNGAVVASASFNKATLDALHGSDASGTFTDASISWTTGSTVAANQSLAIRIVKEGAAGTVLDFDNVRFTTTANDFANYMNGFSVGGLVGFDEDPDGDGLRNGLEAWLGTDPGAFNTGLAGFTSDGTTTTFSHPQNTTSPLDLSGFYEWSFNLIDWYDSGTGPESGPSVTLVPINLTTTTTVTATASEPLGRLFLRVRVSQN